MALDLHTVWPFASEALDLGTEGFWIHCLTVCRALLGDYKLRMSAVNRGGYSPQNLRRIALPSSVLGCGMFCRLGWEESIRPVAVPQVLPTVGNTAPSGNSRR